VLALALLTIVMVLWAAPPISDDFERASLGLGTTYIDTFGTMAIVSSSDAQQNAANDVDAAGYNDTFADDQCAEATFGVMSAGSGDNIGVCLRCGAADSGNGYLIVANTGGTFIVEMTGGGIGIEDSDVVVTWAPGDVLRAEMEGTIIDVFKNDVAISGLQGDDASFTSGLAGIAGVGTANTNTIESARFGNMSGGSCVLSAGAAAPHRPILILQLLFRFPTIQ